jgi:hypothetical protein
VYIDIGRYNPITIRTVKSDTSSQETNWRWTDETTRVVIARFAAIQLKIRIKSQNLANLNESDWY